MRLTSTSNRLHVLKFLGLISPRLDKVRCGPQEHGCPVKLRNLSGICNGRALKLDRLDAVGQMSNGTWGSPQWVRLGKEQFAFSLNWTVSWSDWSSFFSLSSSQSYTNELVAPSGFYGAAALRPFQSQFRLCQVGCGKGSGGPPGPALGNTAMVESGELSAIPRASFRDAQVL